jgi:microsomal dipeptidase-like Zn-dependent dipeptidase
MAHAMGRAVGAGVLVAALSASAWAAPPAAPTGLQANVSLPLQVTLTWNAAPAATSYRIYRSVDPLLELSPFPPRWSFVGTPSPIAVVTGTGYTDVGLPPLVRQFYVVTAVNADGESPLPLVPPPAMLETRVTAPADAPVFGLADLHSHAFANLGFGAKVVWGSAFSPGGASDALQTCDPIHGSLGELDLVGNALGGHLGHHVDGWSDFSGWPNFDSHTHQQMYYEWLKRAYDGGLRLLVVHAVSNQVLCLVSPASSIYSCDDMQAVDRQLDAAESMEAFIAARGGWFRIARSAAEARQIINGGGLAVVLGIEVAELFGCGVNSSCTEDYVAERVDHYYERGVRHLFPIHVFDNAFGGSGLYNELFNYGNKAVNGSFLSLRECSGEGYGFKSQPPDFFLNLVASLLGLGTPPANTFTAECNARGLTPLGASLVRHLMRKKMIIDVDHMSALTADAVLTLAEQQAYPVVAGHTGLSIVSQGQKDHESQKTTAQLGRIAALGGLVAPILEQGERASGAGSGILAAPGSTVANDCGRSSKTWAQAYLGAVALLGGPQWASVALGSDFNGLAGEPGPRFGPNACKDDPAPGTQLGGVGYPFPIFAPAGVNAGHLGRAIAGNRVFDYNTDGLAHVGLLPDFVQDLRSEGVSDQQLQPLFRSAEAYLELWDAIEHKQVFPPSIAWSVLPPTAATEWQAGDVAVTLVATADPQGDPNPSIRYAAEGATSLAATVPGPSTTLPITNEGVTGLTFAAVDDLGASSPEGSLTLQIDRTPPTLTCAGPHPDWLADNVTLGCEASDALSGLARLEDAVFSLETSVAAGEETADAATDARNVADVVGNAATAGPIAGNRIDRKPPTIAIELLPAGGSYLVNQEANASYTCSDGGSGVVSCDGTPGSGAALDTATPGTKAVTVSARDVVGNAASASVSYTVAYDVCLLYDPTKVKKAGSTVPVKLQACDAAGANLSRPELAVTAVSVQRSAGDPAGVPEDAGNANPDLGFRYDASLAGYIYNLSTKGMAGGAWELRFRIAGDPTEHAAPFSLR